MPDPTITAALCIIGNEILSGRTQDKNLAFIADRLTALGIRLAEVRVLRDDEAATAQAVQALAGRSPSVFTSGGLGPTHRSGVGQGQRWSLGVEPGCRRSTQKKKNC